MDVHLIDLTGYGFSSGVRMANNSIQVFCEDIAHLLQLVNPDKPLFLYGHSMGGLSVASFLTNNPRLNVSGAVLSAPLLNMPKSVGINNKKRILIDLLVPEID